MNGLAGITIALAAIIAAIFLLRWAQKTVVREVLKKEGFRTQAVSAVLGAEQLLMAKGADGETLVTRVKSIPDNLSIQVKVAMMPLSHEVYYWFEFADGKRLNATPI